MGGAGKGGIGRCSVAEFGIKADIRSRGIVNTRRILPRRRNRLDDCGQGFVIDFDALGAVFSRVHRFGDDHRDYLPDKTRFIGRQWEVRRLEWRSTAAVVQLCLRRMRRPRLVRNGFEAIGEEIGAGEHRQHAGERQGFFLGDGADHGVRMRRAHHDRVDLARQVFVGGVAAGAAHQAEVFAPAHRRSNAGTAFSHRSIRSFTSGIARNVSPLRQFGTFRAYSLNDQHEFSTMPSRL
jgi:hypothetical protein